MPRAGDEPSSLVISLETSRNKITEDKLSQVLPHVPQTDRPAQRGIHRGLSGRGGKQRRDSGSQSDFIFLFNEKISSSLILNTTFHGWDHMDVHG